MIEVTVTKDDDETQDPKKPGSLASILTNPSASQDPSQTAKTQEPNRRIVPQTAEPPPDFEDKLARLIRARSDAFQKALVDDRGRVLREPMDEQDALRNAVEYLPRFLQIEQVPDEVRSFISGGKMPGGWVPAVGVVKSRETQELEYRAQAGREHSPIYSAFRDYVVDPLGNFGAAALQVPMDIAVSGLRHLGVAPPDAEFNIKTKAAEWAKEAGWAGGATAEELAAISATASIPAKVTQVAAGLPGMAVGFGAGIPGKAFGAIGGATGKLGKALFGRAGETIGHGAGVFGAYEAAAAKPGEVLKSAKHGLLAGAALGMAQNVASFGLRKMFRSAVQSLGPDERAAMDALKRWATENKVIVERGEKATAYEKRVVDSWIKAGLPGAPAMPARKLIAAAMKGGADAIGFSLLDQQFREELIDAAYNGNTAKWESVLTKFAGNFLGAAALHSGGLASIVPWQRRQSLGRAEPVATEPVATEPVATEPTRVEAARAAETAREAQGTEQDLQSLMEGEWPRDVQARWENAIGGSLDNIVPLGFRPTPTPKGTPHRQPAEPTFFKDSVAREHLRGQAAKFEKDVSVEIGGNVATLLPDWFPKNSAVAKQLAGFSEGGTLRVPAKEAKKFVDYYSRRAERKRAEVGQDVTQAIDSFVAKLVEAHGLPVHPEMGFRVEAPEGGPAPSPIGDKRSGEASSKAEAVEGPPGPVKIELPGTPHSFTIEGEVGKPSKSLQEVLGVPAEMPAKTLAELVEKAALESALIGKARLPGEEVSVGVMGTPGRGDAPGMLRRIVAGVAQESLLRPDPKWENAETVPERGKDALEPEQHQAVEELRKSAETRSDREPADQALLTRSIEVLDTVAAKNDKSVAETMAAMPKLAEAIANGEPGAEKALAESLTTKTPEKALADKADANVAAGEKFEVIGVENGKVMVRGPDGKPMTLRDARMAARRAKEGGFIDLDAIAVGVARAWDAAVYGARAGWNFIRSASWDKFQRSQTQRVEDLGMREEAEIGRNGTTAIKRFSARLDGIGLFRMRRLPREQLDSMQELTRDANGAYADKYSRAMDAATGRHFGEVTDLTQAEREVVDLGRAVTLEAGHIAEELGIEQTDIHGRNPRAFTTDPNRRVLVREYTPEMQEARLNRSGPLYEAMIRWLEATYNWTPQEAAQHFTDARSLTSLDATEVRRSIDVIPTHLDVPGHSRPVRVLESRPLEHAERLAWHNSHVMGARSVMPRFDPAQALPNQHPTDPGLEPLPPTAQQMVDRALNQHGLRAAQAVANMVRAMHGMPLKPEMRLLAAGEPGYHFARVWDGLMSIPRAAALTMAFAKNVVEPMANMAHFGRDAVLSGYREVLRAIATGRIGEMHREAVLGGFLSDTKLNDPWRGDSRIETFENSIKKAGELLTAKLRLSQDFNEMVNFVAARTRIEAMRAGEGTQADANALSLLGFERADVDAMLRGQGTPEQYERYQRNIVGQLAGGKSLRGTERSDLAHSRKFNSLVWFTNFFQARSRMLDQLARDIATAPAEQRSEALGQMLRFAGLTILGSAAGNVFLNFLTGNSDGVTDYIREQTAGDAVDVSQGMLKLLASGLVGGLGQPIVEAFDSIGDPGDSRDRVARAGMQLIGPLDAGWKFINFARAMAGVDVPGYENKDALGKVGKYLRDFMPAAKVVHEGLFGIAALAITDKNIELDNAQDSYDRWLRDNRPDEFRGRGRPEERREFLDSMRSIIDRVSAGKKWSDDDLVAAVIDAEAARWGAGEKAATQQREQGKSVRKSPSDQYKEAREAVASSLRDRKMLPEPGKFPTDQVESLRRHLGEKNWQTLKDFDESLDLLSKRVHSANLRSQASSRR